MENYSALCNAPPPLPRESIFSWLSRLCLSQGVSILGMLRYLNLKPTTDLDFQIGNINIDSISTKTGLLVSDFKDQLNLITSLRKFNYFANNYGLRKRGKMLYRFCPLCLQEDEYPYFRMEWRLKLCVSCPIHECLLEDGCSRCLTPIVLPINLYLYVSDTRPVRSLAHCSSCGELLTKVSPATFKGALYKVMDPVSQYFIKIGKFFIDELYKGNYIFNEEIEAMRDNFVMREKIRKNNFKWTAHTWRTKIKRYQKSNPSTTYQEVGG